MALQRSRSLGDPSVAIDEHVDSPRVIQQDLITASRDDGILGNSEPGVPVSDSVSMETPAPSDRLEFLDRFDGVYVTQTVQLGHALTVRSYRRTFSVTSRNHYYLAVMAPVTFRGHETLLANARRKLEESLARAIQETQQDVDDLAVRFNHADTATAHDSGALTTLVAKVITPLSKQHLTLLQVSDTLLRSAEALWIQGAITDDPRNRLHSRVKRRLNATALMAREACVTVMRGAESRHQQNKFAPATTKEIL